MNDDIPTPRTDEFLDSLWNPDPITDFEETKEFARALERELTEARDKYDGLAALVGTVRSMVPVPVRNVKDITPEEHSREIGDAIDALREQRDRLAVALQKAANELQHIKISLRHKGPLDVAEVAARAESSALAALKEGGHQ